MGTPEFKFKPGSGTSLIIACGALAREIVHIIEHNRLKNLDVRCLPAYLHHCPAKILGPLEQAIAESVGRYQSVYVAYGDCGTAGALDDLLERYGVERIAGPHCFAFYEGHEQFAANESDITSFFLTDFFCRYFETFIWQEYGLDKHDSMVEFLFGNYKKLVFIAQTKDQTLRDKAALIAEKLGLEFEYRYRGYGDLGNFILKIAG